MKPASNRYYLKGEIVGCSTSYEASFKLQLALEALRGLSTVGELAERYDLDPALIEEWRDQVMNRLKNTFPGKGLISGKDPKANEPDDLYDRIGQLTLDRNFFAKIFD